MHFPVIFHNLSGYDGHIIMQGIGAMECEDEIKPIPYNMEKYMAFKLGSLRFIDSMQFIKSGLDKLASNLDAQKCRDRNCTNPKHLWRINAGRCFAHPENFKITRSQTPPEMLEIYLKKGVYPYEYMNSWKSLTKSAFHPKEHSTANLIILTLATQSINMLKVYGRKQAVKLCTTTMIFISKLMFSY
jgi:hypothetical protein